MVNNSGYREASLVGEINKPHDIRGRLLQVWVVQTIGGEVTFEIFTYVAIVVALMSMFLVGRHTRSDEEAGRGELLRSASACSGSRRR